MIVIIPPETEPLETFCHTCGQLRLWLKPEKPTTCGNCGSNNIEVDKLESEVFDRLKEEYDKLDPTKPRPKTTR